MINAKFNAPDGPICTDLREAGALLAASADFQHSYPHSWRSKAKVIFRCTPQWFIPMDKPDLLTVDTLMRDEERIARANGDCASALDAIDDTRWVPEKAENRIRAMVEGRPDWVISRQRAWGVPIALYVDRKTGEYLRDAGGQLPHHPRLPRRRRRRLVRAPITRPCSATATASTIMSRSTDILDVWFDSAARPTLCRRGALWRGRPRRSLCRRLGPASRLVPVVAARKLRHARPGALSTRCSPTASRSTRTAARCRRALGNSVDPLAIIRDSGADILRLWVASTDYFEDVRIGKEVLATTTDAYRKLRNTFRYLLGALDDFNDAERVPPAEMPELERWVLHRLAELDAELRDGDRRLRVQPLRAAALGLRQ